MQSNLRASSLMIVLFLVRMTGTAVAQQPDPFGARRADSPVPSAEEASDPERPLAPAVDERLKTRGSAVYRLAQGSRLQVQTGKAGLFGFAGHTHVIQARGFTGEVVYYPERPRALTWRSR